jgi:UDP-N-acetylglucosamine--N-acetylmuramyl-(pentapeptide) pyrophosphoryl-undecaprenol N-acetylglucosamine transferase
LKKKILISTGGTGGHVIPATVFYEHLKNEFDVSISSDLRGTAYLDKNDYHLEIINTPKLTINIFLIPFQFILLFNILIKSILFLKKKRIDILISTGGYMSLPICFAAKILGLKIYLFEPNLVIGRTNKFFLKFCKKIYCYSDEIKNFPSEFINKIEIIKPLIRKKFYSKLSDKSKRYDDQFNLMIIGGSQGAKIFDGDITNSVVDLSKKFRIKVVQQTNSRNIENLKNFYSKNNIESYVFDFDNNLVDLVVSTDLCITRAGASSLSELIFLNIPFLAIPLPSAKDNHQHENANFFKDKGCCWTLNQTDFDREKLTNILFNILDNKNDYSEKLKNMKNFNYKNTWNDINQKIIETINEN